MPDGGRASLAPPDRAGPSHRDGAPSGPARCASRQRIHEVVLPITGYFGGAGKGTKVNLDNLLPDLDLLDDRFDDGALFLSGEAGPAGIEVAGFGEDFVSAEELDLEEVELTLQPGQLIFHGLLPFFERAVGTAESFG
jgi:hypothetical protein